MGRHAGPVTDGVAVHPDARLVETLPGWGLFATAVAAGLVGWTTGDWRAALGVTALGAGSTAVLWWAVRAGERRRSRHRAGGADPEDVAADRLPEELPEELPDEPDDDAPGGEASPA